MTAAKDGGTGSRRAPVVRLRKVRGRSASSARWLERQINDPYVAEAKRRGLRSRAAWKLIQLDDKFRVLRPGARVLDLGAAPGGWTQVAVERAKAGQAGGGRVLAIDLAAMDPVPDAETMTLDFLAAGADATIRDALGGPVDVLLSDMAAPATGHRDTDRIRAQALADAVAEFALEVLAPGGALVMKSFHGATEKPLLDRLKRAFATVRHVKPAASRAESAEIYVVATGFRGAPGGS
ncbi:MAG: RlmE family RNA methyltransferase [Rhodospirillales bacterium]